jgi:hypothetical protein
MAAYGAGHGVQRVQRLCQVIVFQTVRVPVVLHAYLVDSGVSALVESPVQLSDSVLQLVLVEVG